MHSLSRATPTPPTRFTCKSRLCSRYIIPKTIGNRKKRLCVRLCSGDKHHLRKSADRKAQISPVSGTNAFLICAFRSADFLRWCLSPERNLTHNLFFLFPIVFFSMRRRTVQPEVRSFFSVLRSPVTPSGRGKTIAKSANFTKNANCFEECNVLATESVNSAPFHRGETKVQNFWQGKVQNPSPIQRFGKEKCKLLRQFQRY